jgi:hypothetical protein
VTDSVARILDLLDGGLQRSTEASWPIERDECARDGCDRPLDGEMFCKPCRAFMTEETDVDPLARGAGRLYAPGERPSDPCEPIGYEWPWRPEPNREPVDPRRINRDHIYPGIPRIRVGRLPPFPPPGQLQRTRAPIAGEFRSLHEIGIWLIVDFDHTYAYAPRNYHPYALRQDFGQAPRYRSSHRTNMRTRANLQAIGVCFRATRDQVAITRATRELIRDFHPTHPRIDVSLIGLVPNRTSDEPRA